MADGLASSDTIVFPDGSVQTGDQELAAIPPGVGRQQVNIAAGNEAQLVPYNRKRVALIVETPAAGVLVGLGDTTVTGADYTEELAAGEPFLSPVPVASMRSFNNGAGPALIRVTEVTISAD